MYNKYLKTFVHIGIAFVTDTTGKIDKEFKRPGEQKSAPLRGSLKIVCLNFQHETHLHPLMD